MQNETIILSATVDRLATVKAEIARLTSEETALKTVLAECGLPAIDGTMHRAAISQCAGRESIDWKTIAGKFNPSRQLIVAHTSYGEPYSVVRVSARKGV